MTKLHGAGHDVSRAAAVDVSGQDKGSGTIEGECAVDVDVAGSEGSGVSAGADLQHGAAADLRLSGVGVVAAEDERATVELEADWLSSTVDRILDDAAERADAAVVIDLGGVGGAAVADDVVAGAAGGKSTEIDLETGQVQRAAGDVVSKDDVAVARNRAARTEDQRAVGDRGGAGVIVVGVDHDGAAAGDGDSTGAGNLIASADRVAADAVVEDDSPRRDVVGERDVSIGCAVGEIDDVLIVEEIRSIGGGPVLGVVDIPCIAVRATRPGERNGAAGDNEFQSIRRRGVERVNRWALARIRR